jgi:hypothetical protein
MGAYAHQFILPQDYPLFFNKNNRGLQARGTAAWMQFKPLYLEG